MDMLVVIVIYNSITIMLIFSLFKHMDLCFLKFTFSLTNSKADVKSIIIFSDFNQKFPPNIGIGFIAKCRRIIVYNLILVKNRCPVYTVSATFHAIIKCFSRAIG